MKFLNRAVTASVLLVASLASVASANETPNFSFKDVDGNYHRLSEYRGKWVIANYWATYCGPCVAELPALNSIAKRYRGKVVVLGLEAGETEPRQLKQFAQAKGLSFPIVPTQKSTLDDYPFGLVYGVPTTFIVNPEGKVVDTHMGAVSSAQLQRYFRSNKRSEVARDKEEKCVNGFC